MADEVPDVKARGVTVIEKGIPKQTELLDSEDAEEVQEAEENKKKEYPYPQLYLGGSFHKILSTLVENPNCDDQELESIFEEYYDHLNQLDEFSAIPPGDNIRERQVRSMRIFAGEIREQLNPTDEFTASNFEKIPFYSGTQNDKPIDVENLVPIATKKVYETTFFGEVPFYPGINQVETIQVALSDDELSELVRDLGFGDIGQFAQKLLTDPDLPGAVVNAINRLKEDEPNKYGSYMRSAVENDLNNTGDKVPPAFSRLDNFADAIRSYYYFDFQNAKDKLKSDEGLKIEDIPERYKKIILSLSARADILSLSAEEGDKEALALIRNFHDKVKKGTRKHKSLLNLTEVEIDELQKELELLKMIREGRVVMGFCEVKTITSKYKKTGDGNYEETSIDDIRDDYMGDVAHTLWAQYQYLSSVYRSSPTDDEETRERKNSFMKAMGADAGEFSEDVFRAALFAVRHLQNPHVYLLGKIHWPIVDNKEEGVHKDNIYYGLERNPDKLDRTEISTRLEWLSPRKLFRSTASTGKKVIKQMSIS